MSIIFTEILQFNSFSRKILRLCIRSSNPQVGIYNLFKQDHMISIDSHMTM